MPVDQQFLVKILLERHPFKKKYLKWAILSTLKRSGNGLTIKEINDHFEEIGFRIPDSNINRSLSELWTDKRVFGVTVSGKSVFVNV